MMIDLKTKINKKIAQKVKKKALNQI